MHTPTITEIAGDGAPEKLEIRLQSTTITFDPSNGLYVVRLSPNGKNVIYTANVLYEAPLDSVIGNGRLHALEAAISGGGYNPKSVLTSLTQKMVYLLGREIQINPPTQFTPNGDAEVERFRGMRKYDPSLILLKRQQ